MQVHSRVKLVTNSSSETYMFIKNDEMGIEKLKSFITAILRAANSDYTADDLFIFELVPQPSYLDDEISWLESEGKDPDEWSMARSYPNGISTFKMTPIQGVEANSDLHQMLWDVFEVAELGNG